MVTLELHLDHLSSGSELLVTKKLLDVLRVCEKLLLVYWSNM